MSKTEKFTFQNARGNTLSGRIEHPSGTPAGYAIFAHCFACTKNFKATTLVGRRLAERGIGVLRFDFTGLGESEGDTADASIATDVDDVVAAAEAMAEAGFAPGLLIGHSLGGAAVVLAAPAIKSIKAVCTIGAPSDPAHVLKHFGDAGKGKTPDEPITVNLGGRPFRVQKRLSDALHDGSVLKAAGALHAALLICHAPRDQVVGIEHAAELFQAAKHPKSFLSLDDADHLLTAPEDAAFAADMIAVWARRHTDAPAEAETTTETNDGFDAEAGTVRVTEAGPHYQQTISIGGRHRLAADEPADVGGGDRGPNPYELLQSALGACKSMTVRMYADRKGWPLKRVSVNLQHGKVAAEEGDSAAKIDRFDVALSLEGDLSSEQRQRLLEISARCPVHRTLKGEVQIDSALAEELSGSEPETTR